MSDIILPQLVLCQADLWFGQKTSENTFASTGKNADSCNANN